LWLAFGEALKATQRVEPAWRPNVFGAFLVENDASVILSSPVNKSLVH